MEIDVDVNKNINNEEEHKSCCCENEEIDEGNLACDLAYDFDEKIIERGENYYDEGHVKAVYKDKNKYYAKVLGHNDNIYDVEITIDNKYDAEYKCSCPYEYACKHAYATLLAIDDGEYKSVSLKEEIKKEETSFKDIMAKVPSDELKAYLMSDEGRNTIFFHEEPFNKHFRKYLPKQKYEYYYNNLYNAINLDDDYDDMIEVYLSNARENLKAACYDETFKIIQSIIEAMHDMDILDMENYDFELLCKMGMLLRIVYRKCSGELKNSLYEWFNKLEQESFYNNCFLEDIILSLR